MGSVKDQIQGDSPGGRLFRKPGFNSLGLGAWQVSGRFSVGDLKELIPPIEIRDKNYILAMTSARYWEQASAAGFQHTYAGMLDKDGKITDVETLMDRGELSDIIVMKLGVTPHVFGDKITDETRAIYHRLINSGDINVFVADAECIHRWGFPLGSSTFKKIFGAANMVERYEKIATYADTIVGLDEIRAIPGIMQDPAMVRVLAAAGLDCIPNPGHMIAEPAINFDTKFRPAGDATMTEDEARLMMHLDPLAFMAWRKTVAENARHQRDYCKALGLMSIDGKTEGMVVNGFPIFTDFACNPDENRIMLAYTAPDGRVYMIPANKEIQRAIFRVYGIYDAIEQAKADHDDAWQAHLVPHYRTKKQIGEAAVHSIRMMEEAIASVGNALLGRTIFDATPIERWVGDFLPYASIMQQPMTK